MEQETQEQRTILVVDDQPDNLKVLTSYLKSLGCALRVAMTGEKALELARQFPPDLILLDVMMPGIDGFETCRRLKADATTCHVPVIFMTALTDTADKIAGFQVGAVDYITKPLQHEEVMARVNVHLSLQHLQNQLRQKNRVVEEQNTQLLELNTQLQELNASKDAFFSIIAHDLRSPFAGLLGLTQLILDGIDLYKKDQIKNYIGQLRDASEKLYELLENLLTWSRLQRGLIQQSPEPLKIQNIIEKNLRLFSANAEHKQIEFQHARQENPAVFGDVNMINTVVRNLISNSLKFTPEEGRITISTQLHLHHLQVSVTDTGIGIQADQLDALFRIDKRHQRPGTAGEKGTGLGLILCKELVEKNGGKIWAQSEVGKGTTFHFTIPLFEPELEEL